MAIVIVGCGVVGAAIAYELSQISNLSITVLDRQQPAQAATGAALGVLMGAISQRAKGNNWRMRQLGIQKYNAWVPQLEAIAGRSVPFNQQGILRLCFEGETLDSWLSLAAIRQQQRLPLVMLNLAQLAADYPQLNLERVIGAVYSPSDRQIDPTALTLALVAAAQHNGVIFNFDAAVTGIETSNLEGSGVATMPERRCRIVHTDTASFAADWLVIAAGLGSVSLTTQLQQPVDLRPVLGQAVRVQVPQPLDDRSLQPVITGEDTHIVPIGDREYWIGATVEFLTGTEPLDSASYLSDPVHLELMMQRAIAFCPALAHATRVYQWSGLRPRPEGRPAPIIERLPGYTNVILATGHYRNGVLLAPATAERVRALIVPSLG